MSENSYLKNLEETLKEHRELLTCLENRIVLINQRNHQDDPFQQNENKITIIRTNSEIHTLKKVIKEKHDYFVKYAAEFDVKLKDMEQNFTKVHSMAKAARFNNKPLDQYLASVNNKMIDEAIEYKVNFYFELKKYLKLK